MKFKDLLKVKYCDRTTRIEAQVLQSLLPNTPLDVIEQFYSDHGRNSVFQRSYSALNIEKIEWGLLPISANKIIGVSYNPAFNRVNSVKHRAEFFSERGWSCVDSRPQIVEYWSQNKTWQRAPVLLNGNLMQAESDYWLVEGHTRVGVLLGLVEQNIVAVESEHLVWLGKTNA